jgi:hypothetical protein
MHSTHFTHFGVVRGDHVVGSVRIDQTYGFYDKVGWPVNWWPIVGGRPPKRENVDFASQWDTPPYN